MISSMDWLDEPHLPRADSADTQHDKKYHDLKTVNDTILNKAGEAHRGTFLWGFDLKIWHHQQHMTPTLRKCRHSMLLHTYIKTFGK